jgi:SsrA-binding protein
VKKYYKVVSENRKAYHDYQIIERYSAGIVLSGNEVKSCRLGKVNLKDSYVIFKDGEAYLLNLHIGDYEKGRERESPNRTRKLLLNRQELRKLIGKVSQRGLTIIPLKIFFSGNWAKAEIALVKSKKKYEKKEKLKEKAVKKDIDREAKGLFK